jgi:hypothetical protein
MTNWCHVQDGLVMWGPGSLPRTYENTSNFAALPEAELRARGWRPHRFIATAAEGQVITGSTTVVTDTEVVETQTARDLTPAEIAERDKAAVPFSVSLWQFRTALRLNGNFERVQYALAQLQSPENILAAELFEYGNSIYRSSTLAAQLITILGVTDEQVDALFIQAAQIKV